jgi:hypothetical protein
MSMKMARIEWGHFYPNLAQVGKTVAMTSQEQ